MYWKTPLSLSLLLLSTFAVSATDTTDGKASEGCSLAVIFVVLIGGVVMGSGITALVTFYLWRYNQLVTPASDRFNEERPAEDGNSLTRPAAKKKIRPSAMVHSVPKSCEAFNMDNLDKTVITQLGKNPDADNPKKDNNEAKDKDNNLKKKPRKAKKETTKGKQAKKELPKVAADVGNVEVGADGEDLKRSDKKKRNADRKKEFE